MSNQTTWTDNNGGIFNANATNPLPASSYGVAQDTAITPVANGTRTDIAVNRYGITYIAAGDYDGTAGSDGRNLLSGFSRRDAGIANTPTPVAMGGYILNGTSWDRLKKPNLTSRIPSAAASTNATSAKASAGEVHSIIATNTTASVKYLKLYNKASAPTVGTDTPVLTIALAPSNALTSISFPNGGEYFSAGISYALTGAAADADATAVAAGDVVGLNIAYS